MGCSLAQLRANRSFDGTASKSAQPVRQKPRAKDHVEFQTAIFERRAGAARMAFNRPEAMNAYTPTMSGELKRAVENTSDDRTARAVVTKGMGGRRRRGQASDYRDIVLVSCLGNALTKSPYLFQNRICGCRPNEGMRVTVILINKLVYFSD